MGGSKLPSTASAIGLLFGIQDGQDVSIFDGTEAKYNITDGIWSVDADDVIKKKGLWTAVYTNYELLGWYTVGDIITSAHMDIHKSVKDYVFISVLR